MGINVIVKGIIALFLIGIIYLGVMPTVTNLADDPSLFDGEVSSNTLFLKDNALTIFYVSGLLAFFSIIVWMFNASSSSGAMAEMRY